MFVKAFLKSVDQILEPRFRKVFFFGIVLALVTIVIAFLGLQEILPEGPYQTGYDWLNTLLEWSVVPLFLISLYFLFPALSTFYMGFFLDDIIEAVEEKHYPGRQSTIRLGLRGTIKMTFRLAVVLIGLNLLALPLYIVLLFTGFGPFLLFFLLNAYLLGREYFEMVGAKHLELAKIKTMRKQNFSTIFVTGAGITALFLVPFVNLAAPLLGAAMMVHVFHDLKGKAPHA